jgi:hypothetical protein
LDEVEGVSFDRWVLVWVLVWVFFWVFFWVILGSPFDLPGICDDPPFGCELSKGGVGDVDDAAADGGSLNSGRGFNVDARTVG